MEAPVVGSPARGDSRPRAIEPRAFRPAARSRERVRPCHGAISRGVRTIAGLAAAAPGPRSLAVTPAPQCHYREAPHTDLPQSLNRRAGLQRDVADSAGDALVANNSTPAGDATHVVRDSMTYYFAGRALTRARPTEGSSTLIGLATGGRNRADASPRRIVTVNAADAHGSVRGEALHWRQN